MRRNRIGTKSADLWAWEPQDISKMQGSLFVQEYLQELIRSDPSNYHKICEQPKEVDISVWQYEHLRQFVLELNLLVTQLKRVCNKMTCPKMVVGNNMFVCAAH